MARATKTTVKASHKGRLFTLRRQKFKGELSLVWYVDFNGPFGRMKKTTKTTDLATATSIAKRLVEECWETRMERRERLGTSALTEVCEVWLRAGVVKEPKASVAALKRMWQKTTDKSFEAATVDDLTERLVEWYVCAVQGREVPDYLDPREDSGVINRTVMRARQIFSGRARKAGIYQKLLFEWPDTFLTAPLPRMLRGLDRFEPIDPSALNAMDEEANELHEDLAAAYWFSRLMGLRATELLHTRQNWMEGGLWVCKDRPNEPEARPGQGGCFRPKGVHSYRKLAVPQDLQRWFHGHGNLYVVAPRAEKTQRYNLIYRDLSDFIRGYVDGGSQTLHRLRGQAISTYLDKVGGDVYKASRFGGQSPDVLVEHYAEVLDAPSLSIEDL